MFKKKLTVKKKASPAVKKSNSLKKTASLKKITTVDQYISSLPRASQTIARQLRATIKEAAPKAQELVSYNMPLYKQDGMLISFAAWKDHIGVYPLTDNMEKDIPETLQYKGAKHSLKFLLSLPVPFKLVSKIVKYRIKENARKA